MNFAYRVYGLNVASSRYLPYLCSTTSTGNTDVHVTFVGNRPVQQPPDGYFRFWEQPEGGLGFWARMAVGWAEYVISPDGSTIRIAHPDETPLLEVMRCLAGVSLGAALRFKNVLVLHASTVSVNGAALAFAAPPGAGKSTLSAAFHQRGYSLISEDVVALDEREDGYTVRPGYAGVRLYPEALEYLYGPAVAAEALPVDQKRLHRLDAIPEAPCPLRAVYVLAPRNPDLRAPCITSLS